MTRKVTRRSAEHATEVFVGACRARPDTTIFRVRLDPEFFITAKGPFIYYNRLVPEHLAADGTAIPAINDGVWRVDTGLGPRLPD